MRTILILSLVFATTFNLFAQQGIQFEHGDWQQQLAKAKQENKLVFVDVYTSWCGPCKLMVAEVFPKKEVGDLFNSSFVNYKIDAEKGEGIQLAKNFEVQAYPTYLFVNGDGELVYRLSGYLEPALFLQEAGVAIKEKNDPKPIIKWEAEYEAGNRDKEFLKEYLQKLAKLRKPAAEIIDAYWPQLDAGEKANKELISTLLYADPNIQYVPAGPFNTYIAENYKALDSLLGKGNNYSISIVQQGMRNYFRKNIIENKREDMLPVMVKATLELSRLMNNKDSSLIRKRLIVDYYAGTGNEQKLIPAVHDYVENGLMKMDIASMQAADKMNYEKFREPYVTGKEDSSKLSTWYIQNRLSRNAGMVNFSYSLRDASEAVYRNVVDKKTLGKAANWSKQADQYFPHFSSKAVYAALLYKLGKTKQAVDMMQLAASDPFLKEQAETQKLILNNAELMKKGTAPTKLWRN